MSAAWSASRASRFRRVIRADSLVGQVVNLRPIGNRPAPRSAQSPKKRKLRLRFAGCEAYSESMQSRPAHILLGATCIVGAGAAALPSVTGYGTILFQVVGFGAWAIAASITSGRYVDTHHVLLWSVACILNLALFLIPATGIYFAARKRWSTVCSLGIVAWCVFYLLSLFWLFPANDGP